MHLIPKTKPTQPPPPPHTHTRHRRMTCLERLSLRQCTAVPPEPDAGPAGSLRRPPASVHWTLPLLQALPALRSVELVSMPWLRDEDFAGIGRLTALTSLLVCASGTMQVGGACAAALRAGCRARQHSDAPACETRPSLNLARPPPACR